MSELGQADRSGRAVEPSRRWPAVALGLVFFALYAATACPGVYWYDSAELVAAGVNLRVPHPPGYPLYVWTAHVVTRLPLDPAWALNLMSAAFSALNVALCFALSRRLGASAVGAVLGACALGLGPTVWDNATIAEVYPPALTAILCTWLLIEAGLDDPRPTKLWAAAGVAGLGLGYHPFVASLGLGFAWLVLTAGIGDGDRRSLRRLLETDGRGVARRIGVGVVAGLVALAGASQYLWILSRLAESPDLITTPAPGWTGFWWYVRGGNYPSFFQTGRDFRALHAAQIGGALLAGTAYLGLPLAVAGIVRLARTRVRWALALSLGVVGNVAYFFDYHVHDLEVFVLPSIVVLCVAIGPGFDALVGRLETASETPGRARRLAVGLMAAALVSTPILHGFRGVRPTDRSAQRWLDRVSRDLPPNARLVHWTSPYEWRSYTVFHLYGQQLQGRRPDVRVVEQPHPVQLDQAVRAGRPIYVFSPAAGNFTPYPMIEEAGVWRLVPP